MPRTRRAESAAQALAAGCGSCARPTRRAAARTCGPVVARALPAAVVCGAHTHEALGRAPSSARCGAALLIFGEFEVTFEDSPPGWLCRSRLGFLETWKSARRLPPPWPRAPALTRPASRQHQQAALVPPTRASGQPMRVWPLLVPTHSPLCRPSTPWSGSNRGKGCGFGRESDGEAFARVFVCLSVWVYVRACACTHVYVKYTQHPLSHIRVCVCV